MSTYGLKVSKAGYDVKTADPENLVFSSEYFTNKIYLDGTVNVVATTSSDIYYYGYAQIDHSLGYLPIFQVFGEFDNMGAAQGYMALGSGAIIFEANSGTETLTIEMYQSSAGTYPIRYFIFYDKGVEWQITDLKFQKQDMMLKLLF